MRLIKYFALILIIILLGCNKDITTDSADLTISSPLNNATVYGNVDIKVSVNNSDIKRVDLYVENADKKSLSSSPYVFSFDFTPYDGHTVTVYCRGYDSNNNFIAESNHISLVVSSSGNNDPDPQ